MLSYQVRPCFSIYAGYYMMWADGLALAVQQVGVGANQIDHNGFLFYQGATLGVEATW